MFLFIFRTYYYLIFPYYFIGKTYWIFKIIVRTKKRLTSEIEEYKYQLQLLKSNELK